MIEEIFATQSVWFSSAYSLPPMPAWYLYGFAFLLGALVGSFLNVCILRIPQEGVSILYPRHSRCPQCEQPIQWYDNIPILSYLLLRGKCRKCQLSISLQYPLVELLTAVMAVAVVKRFGATLAALAIFVFVCGLIVITFIDIAYWIIPDVISLPGIPLGILAAWAFGAPLPSWQEAVWGAVVGGGVFLAISLGYEILMKRPGLGMGDVKLLAMIGAFLGWRALPAVILLASAQGLLVAVVLFFLGWRQSVPEDEFDEHPEGAAKESKDSADTSAAEVAKNADSTGSIDAPTSAPSAEPSESKESAPAPEANEATEAATSTASTVSTASTALETSTESTDIAEPKKETSEGSEGSEGSEALEEDAEVGFRTAAIQFGPFLCLAALEALFWGEKIALWWFGLLRF